jgi:hypothetical protein
VPVFTASVRSGAATIASGEGAGVAAGVVIAEVAGGGAPVDISRA